MSTLTATQKAAAVATRQDPRWEAVVARDLNANGKFYYSVETTGVYCRPSCPSRLAKPENVRFHATRADAERTGLRPCKRCQPNQPPLSEQQASKIVEVCRLIEESEEALSLNDLANHAGMSTYHFHRTFQSITGVTPRSYAAAHRTKRVRCELSRSDTVTRAIFDAGFNSNGRFYETSNQVLGMTPSDYRAGGTNTEIRFAIGECSLGSILVATSERGVCAILLGDDPDALARQLQDQFPRAKVVGGDKKFERLVAEVVGFIEAPALGLSLPLDVRGTAFQQRVWQALIKIPAGSTASYADIAKQIGIPEFCACGGAGLCGKHARSRDTVPSGGENRWRPVGLSVGCQTQASPVATGESCLSGVSVHGSFRPLEVARYGIPISAVVNGGTKKGVDAVPWANGCLWGGRQEILGGVSEDFLGRNRKSRSREATGRRN